MVRWQGSRCRALYSNRACVAISGKKKAPGAAGGRNSKKYFQQPQDPPEPQELAQEPAPLNGTGEEIEKPERGPASMKSTLISRQLLIRPLSTRNFNPSRSKTSSFSFGSSRAKPKEGPAQPPCMMATRMGESILCCAKYSLRFFCASSVTSNTSFTSYLLDGEKRILDIGDSKNGNSDDLFTRT
jgi:hypothetical protein